MKEYIKKTLLCIVPLLFAGNFLLANDVYVTQSGDTLDLDITQDGQNNTCLLYTSPSPRDIR